MDYANSDGIVSTEWLETHLYAPDVRVVDASFWQPSMQRDAKSEYADCHLPNAMYFDIDIIADANSGLPHMLPTPKNFAAMVGKMGLGDGQRIIAYDGVGGGSAAARVWWMFRAFGHRDVAVLEGGLPKWLREQRPVDDRVVIPTSHVFTPRFDPSLIRRLDEVAEDMKTHREQILDGRKAISFQATASDYQEGRHGHIPGSLNLPVAELVDSRELTILPPDKLKQRFVAAGIDFDRPVVATCGEGITCCLLTLALYLLGKTDVANYDGSWTEWAAHAELPVERGEVKF
ncbi:MAG: sulfurtransferase [Alphaproteobacteria bacterium]|nr:sulfurtransferase [Alphaproteobacteria bacterium]